MPRKYAKRTRIINSRRRKPASAYEGAMRPWSGKGRGGSYKRYPSKRRRIVGSYRHVKSHNSSEESTRLNWVSKSKPKKWVRTQTKITAAQYTKFLSSEIVTAGNGFQACKAFEIGKTSELDTITNNAQTVSAAYRSSNASVLLESMSARIRLTNSCNVPATVTVYQMLARRSCEIGPLALWDKYMAAEGSSAYKVSQTPFRAKGFGAYWKILKTRRITIQGGATITISCNFDVGWMLAKNELDDGDSQFNVPFLTRAVMIAAQGGLVQDSVNRSQVTTGDVSIAYDLHVNYKWSVNAANSTTIFENGQYGLITNVAKFVNEDSDEIVQEENV